MKHHIVRQEDDTWKLSKAAVLNIKYPNNNMIVSIALFWFRGIILCYKLNLNCFHHVFPGHHVDMAEEHGALLVALEHRFYGDSINPDGLKTENLASLSSQQALVMASYLSVCVPVWSKACLPWF